jgi:hypothetical protein
MSTENIDRGDEYVGTEDNDKVEDPIKVDDKAADKETDKAAAEDDAKASDKQGEEAEDDDDKDKDGEEDQPRDKSGKFTKKSADKPILIPKARVDEIIRTERSRADDLQRQLDEIKAGKTVQALETEITDLEKQHAKLLLDGKGDEAAVVAGQIRAKERQIQIDSAKAMSEASKEAAREDIRLDLTIERIEADYPQLNENSDEYDQDAVDLVLASQQQLMATQKLPASKALAEAARKVMSRLYPAKTDEPAAPAKKLDKAKDGERSKAQLEKNIDTISKQPADLKDAGADSDKQGIKDNVDVTRLSFDEFSALPETTKARLRGDMLA